jgi:hypothetical protein
MTESEAAELLNGSAFADQPDILETQFNHIRDLLASEGLSDWLSCYQATVQLWQPFGPSEPSIEDLIVRSVDRLNSQLQLEPRLVPQFHRIHELVKDRALLRHLRETGCVVVVDAVSLRHPELQRAFHQSLLDAYQSTSVVVVAPCRRAVDESRELTIMVQLRLSQLEFARRSLDWDDEYTCIETHDRGNLQKWLFTRFRAIAAGSPVKSGIRKYMTLAAGER